MLKKKSQLPPRPKPPNAEQIAEDLERASIDDIVFTLRGSTQSGGTETASEEAHTRDLERVWGEVQEFTRSHTELKRLLSQLRSQSEQLQASELELRAMADEIRKQALDALK